MPGICPRCDKNVYFAEEKQALGKSWHKLCFVCGNCRKLLDSGNITEHGGDMFCNSCYRKNFGPKGYGFGGLHMDDGKNYTTNKIEDHQAKAYVAPKAALLSDGGSSTGSKSPSPPATAKSIANKAARSSPNGTAPKPKTFPKWGGAEVCPRCEKPVFIAELMRGAGRAWHKSCFTCLVCNKRIDSSNMCERDSEIYCRACYGKNFGPKGFGYGIGAGTLQMT